MTAYGYLIIVWSLICYYIGLLMGKEGKEMTKTDYCDEAKRILPLIDELRVTKEKEYHFIQSMKSKVKFNEYVSDKCIYWLRDIKDRQLAGEEHEMNEGYSDRPEESE